MTDLPVAVVAIPLAQAAICLNCEWLFYLAGSNRCPICAGEHFAMIESFIGSTNEKAGAVNASPE